jgi:cysteinyl-tRNA synthetase
MAQAAAKRRGKALLRRDRVKEYHPIMTARLLRGVCALLAAGAGLLLVCSPARVTPGLNAVKSWAFQLQNVDPAEIRLSPYDLVVIDYGFDRLNSRGLPREVLDGMRSRPDGRRRLILAYLNVGEADDFRYYWQASWPTERPDWLGVQNADSPGNYLVKYWDPAWQAIIYGNPQSYVGRILNAGFDGVYVDGGDRFERWKRTRPSAASEMINLVGAIAAYGRKERNGFLVVPQNGDALLSNAGFVRSIDGFAREDLLYSEKGPEVRNSNASILDSTRRLQWVVGAGKPVFVIEYTSNPQLAASMLREIRQLGFIGYVGGRDLKALSPPAFGCGQPDCSQ